MTELGSDDAGWREQSLRAFAAGRLASAHSTLAGGLAGSLDLEALNDLAVMAHALGRDDEARALLQAVLALAPQREDARANLAALTPAPPAWRESAQLGGPDPDMPERAFPGMPSPETLSEHCSRYAFAVLLVSRARVLDLGCGTGYGSEMLSWSAAEVRGFDLWQPEDHERPRWPGVSALTYGHDLCVDPLPRADVAVMFEVVEHLPDAPRALEIAWGAVHTLVASFPNPVFNGSWKNPYHVNDWTLDRFEKELRDAAVRAGHDDVEITHLHQQEGAPFLTVGRDPQASFWVAVGRTAGSGALPDIGYRLARRDPA